LSCPIQSTICHSQRNVSFEVAFDYLIAVALAAAAAVVVVAVAAAAMPYRNDDCNNSNLHHY
jgi:hypothetical protein